MKKIFKEPLFYLVLVLAFGLGVMVWNFVLAQQANWSEPTAAFPSGQVAPPIDTSDATQTKTGNLGIAANLNVDKLATIGGIKVKRIPGDPTYDIAKVTFSGSSITYGANGICLPDVSGGSISCKDNWAAIGTGGGGVQIPGGITGYEVVTNSTFTPYVGNTTGALDSGTRNLSQAGDGVLSKLIEEVKAQISDPFCPPDAIACGGGGATPTGANFAYTVAQCSTGKKVLGGGCNATPDALLLKSRPYPSASEYGGAVSTWDSWFCASEYRDGVTLTAYAICANTQ